MTVAAETLRLNVGCGGFPLRGWINIDADPQSAAQDQYRMRVPPLPFADRSVAEVYAGHFFEHLNRRDAGDFLDECYRVLVPGGRLGLMVPDMREVMRRYVLAEPAPAEYPQGTYRDLRDLDELCDFLIFSTAQPSRHQWAYDGYTLSRALQRAGFQVIGEFDRFHDPRVAVGAWYQIGIDAVRPA